MGQQVSFQSVGQQLRAVVRKRKGPRRSNSTPNISSVSDKKLEEDLRRADQLFLRNWELRSLRFLQNWQPSEPFSPSPAEQQPSAALIERTTRRRSSAPDSPLITPCEPPPLSRGAQSSPNLRSTRRPAGVLKGFQTWSFGPPEAFMSPLDLSAPSPLQSGPCTVSTAAGIALVNVNPNASSSKDGVYSFVDYACNVFTPGGDANASTSHSLPRAPSCNEDSESDQAKTSEATESAFACFCQCFRSKNTSAPAC